MRQTVYVGLRTDKPAAKFAGKSRERGEWSTKSPVDDGGLNEVLIWSCDESAPRRPPLFRAGAPRCGVQAVSRFGTITSPNPVRSLARRPKPRLRRLHQISPCPT